MRTSAGRQRGEILRTLRIHSEPPCTDAAKGCAFGHTGRTESCRELPTAGSGSKPEAAIRRWRPPHRLLRT